MKNISRRDCLKAAAAGGILLSGSGDTRLQAEQGIGARKPNVLFIMTDTQRRDDMGAFGNPAIKTPHLDSLARGGVMFRNCYTPCPACMPARATVFTGRFPMAHRVWSNGVPLPEDEITLAQVFLENGYRTGGAGKFHFLPHFPYRENPLPLMETHPEPFYGFEEFHLGEDGRSGEHYVWMKENHPRYADLPDNRIPVELHNSMWSANHTIHFIEKCAREDTPFFAFCSFVDPHQAYNPPPPYDAMYRQEDMPLPLRKEGELDRMTPPVRKIIEGLTDNNNNVLRHRTQHYGEMSLIDDAVGRILRTLDDLKIRENTIIAFVADHGDMLGDHFLFWKGIFHYPECSNVPLFFNWKGHILGGRSIDGLMQQVDVMPTVLDLAGLTMPFGVQGKSMKSLLTADTADTGYDSVYVESSGSGQHHPEYIGPNEETLRGRRGNPSDVLTIRTFEWRLTAYMGKPYGELYDLKNDPHEFVNRWDDVSLKDRKGELMALLLERLNTTRDPLPMKTRPY